MCLSDTLRICDHRSASATRIPLKAHDAVSKHDCSTYDLLRTRLLISPHTDRVPVGLKQQCVDTFAQQRLGRVPNFIRARTLKAGAACAHGVFSRALHDQCGANDAPTTFPTPLWDKANKERVRTM